jgi:hypothetical protein
MLRPIATLSALALLTACSAYQPIAPGATTASVRSDARDCQLSSLNPSDLFGLAGGALTGFRQQSDMDACMSARGWRRK